MKSSNEIDEIKKKFNALLAEKNYEEGIKHDAFILMSQYLSEIDRISNLGRLNRGTLAKNINVSPSYLTQVFRGNKPLNFYTIAKIQRAMNIKFSVAANFKNEIVNSYVNTPVATENIFHFNYENYYEYSQLGEAKIQVVSVKSVPSENVNN